MIIGSGNLTEPGYRKNVEVFGTIDVSREVGGDKAAWIRDMWATLASWPRVRGIVWFNYAKETDWRIDSSDAALAAYRDGLPGFLAG